MRIFKSNYLIILFVTLAVCNGCIAPRSRSSPKRFLDNNEWKLEHSVSSKEVFYQDTLKFVFCNHCYSGALAYNPAINFSHFSLENNGSFNFFKPQKNGFTYSTTIKVDSSSAEYKSDFHGKWKIRGKGNNMRLILKNIKNCSDELDGYFPPKSQKKGKVIYSVIFLNKDAMILVRQK